MASRILLCSGCRSPLSLADGSQVISCICPGCKAQTAVKEMESTTCALCMHNLYFVPGSRIVRCVCGALISFQKPNKILPGQRMDQMSTAPPPQQIMTQNLPMKQNMAPQYTNQVPAVSPIKQQSSSLAGAAAGMFISPPTQSYQSNQQHTMKTPQKQSITVPTSSSPSGLKHKPSTIASSLNTNTNSTVTISPIASSGSRMLGNSNAIPFPAPTTKTPTSNSRTPKLPKINSMASPSSNVSVNRSLAGNIGSDPDFDDALAQAEREWAKVPTNAT
eukprot:TRINITY_DN777971_c0_g1_i1.p1 TRINITY_DN777971_c0_g1~~TRINITY_DN777971_c0_g1_i1.p1  ORF type:complete len:276 (-),score=62.27 TRINITY_DN777971_c0_g1_i1:307-1134(-)